MTARYFAYIGDKASVTQKGVTFERNVPTAVTEAAHIAKLEGNSHWKECEAPIEGNRQPEPQKQHQKR